MGQKNLREVIEAVKSNEDLTEEELRMAVLCLDSLMEFDFRSMMNLYKAEKDNKKPFMVYSAVWQFNERFERLKRVMNQIPKTWVGENNMPDNHEYQKRRAISKKIVEKVLSKNEKTN